MYGINIKEFLAIKKHTIIEAEIFYKLKKRLFFTFNNIKYIDIKEDVFIKKRTRCKIYAN